MRHRLRLGALIAFVCAAGGLGPTRATIAQSGAIRESQVFFAAAEEYPPELKATLNAQHGRLKQASSRQSLANHATLAPPASELVAAVAEGRLGPRRTGFGREVPDVVAKRMDPAALQWSNVDEGRVAVFSVTSPGAAATRLGLVVGVLPAGTELRVFGAANDSTVFGPFTLPDIRRQSTEATSDGPGMFWTPLVSGDMTGVEIFVPTASVEAPLAFSLQKVAHLTAADDLPPCGQPEEPCALYLEDFGSVSRSVMQIDYIVNATTGDPEHCTGTLLSDSDLSTRIPYILTANHCINTPSQAATVSTKWNYLAPGCVFQSPLAVPGVVVPGGAILLAHDPVIDFAFLRLNAPAPATATFAGWTTATPSLGMSVASIHHPQQRPQKLALGRVEGLSDIAPEPSTAAARFYRVRWSIGTTEDGSSGAGLFSGSGIYGHLSQGEDRCFGDVSWYTRFSDTYPFVRAWLQGGAPASLSPPTGLTGSVVGNTVSLRWNGAAGAGSYRLRAGSTPGGSNAFDGSVGSVTTLTAAAPQGGYYIRVYAVAGGVESGPSNEILLTVPGGGGCTLPSAPTQRAPSVSGLTVTLTWNAAANATSYVIEAGSSSGAANLATFDTGTALTAFSGTGPPGSYFVRVRGKNACGAGSASNEVTFVLAGR